MKADGLIRRRRGFCGLGVAGDHSRRIAGSLWLLANSGSPSPLIKGKIKTKIQNKGISLEDASAFVHTLWRDRERQRNQNSENKEDPSALISKDKRLKTVFAWRIWRYYEAPSHPRFWLPTLGSPDGCQLLMRYHAGSGG